MDLVFGYYPRSQKIRSGPIEITPADDIDNVIAQVSRSPLVESRWFYAPPQPVFGRQLPRPYSSRVFGLPKTHRLEHARSQELAHLQFLMHCLGFFEGMRLDDTDRGYLDATPIEQGVLNDFFVTNLDAIIDLADAFWSRHISNPQVATTLLAVYQSLALAQRPQSLAFERFIYTYTAIEGCFAVGRMTHGISNTGGHGDRTDRLCSALGIPTPAWLERRASVNVINIRNRTIHEGLFLDQPLGFASFHDAVVPDDERYRTNALARAMLNLSYRLVVGLFDIPANEYLVSSTYERNVFHLDI